jgi:hypothetical protein
MMKHPTIETTTKKIKTKAHGDRPHKALAKVDNARITILPDLTEDQRKIQIDAFKDWQDWNDESMDIYETYLKSE